MTPANQSENEQEPRLAPERAQLAAVSPDGAFASKEEIEAAIAALPELPKKRVSVEDWRIAPVEAVVTHPKSAKATRWFIIIAQISGGIASAVTVIRKALDWIGLEGVSFMDILRAGWLAVRKFIGYSN